MAGLARKIFVNWQTKKLQLSDESATPVDPPTFQRYETVPLCIVIIEPCDPWGPNDFQRIDITNVSLKVAINDTLDDASPLAEQATWTKNTANNTFEGNLVLNNPTFNSWIGSSETKSAYLEIEATEGVAPRVKIYSSAITVKGSVLQPTTTSPDPTREYYTKQEMEGIFVQFRLQPGQTISIPNPANTHERIIGCQDDATELDSVIPV